MKVFIFNHMRNKIFLFIVIFFLFHGWAQSQVTPSVTKSTIIEQYKGKPYYIHFVKADETISLISKTYGVAPERILQENEEAKEGIFTNMILKIPVTDVALSPAETAKQKTVKDKIIPASKNAVNETRNIRLNAKNDSVIVTKTNIPRARKLSEKNDNIPSAKLTTTTSAKKDKLSLNQQGLS